MNEKEMNLMILSKLYDAAEDTWKGMEKRGGVTGAYSAKDVLSLIKREGAELPEEERSYTVTVGSFTCTFTSAYVFDLVTKFERLCSVKGKNKRLFAAELEGSGELVVSCTINESMADLADFTGRDPVRPVLRCVCVDSGKRLAYASDGHALQFHCLNVCGGEASGKDNRRPLIPAADWKKMCHAAGDGAELKCYLTGKGGFSRWNCECNGVVSGFPADRPYPDAVNVAKPVSAENLLALTDDAWKELQKNLKAIKDKEAVVTFRHKECADTITVTVERPGEVWQSIFSCKCECAATPRGRYYFAASAWRIAKFKKFLLYIPTAPSDILQFHDESGRLTLILQSPPVGETAYSLSASNTFSPLSFCHPVQKSTGGALKPVNEEAKETTDTTAKPEALEEAKEKVEEAVTAVPIDVQPLEGASKEPPVPTPTVKPRTDDEVKTEPKPETPKPEKTKERKEKPAPSLDTDAKKFTLEKVGVNVGDALTFVDGTRVTAAAGNKVEYNGEIYTLTGFCKAFMPEAKRNKADAYRGCEYFYNAAGIKLGKLIKEYQKSVAAPLEARNEEPGKAVTVDVRPLKAARRATVRKDGEKPVRGTETGKKRTWLRRMLGSMHRIAAAFSLL